MKNKKPLFIVLITLDVLITIFLFVISIIMLANIVGKTGTQINEMEEGFIKYLATHTTFYLLVFVIPLFVLLAANIVALVIYVKKSAKKEQIQISDLTDEQKEALKKELLDDLKEGDK